MRLAGLIIVLAIVATHWPPAGAEFTLDDHGFVARNTSIHSLGAATAAFAQSFPPGEQGRGLYRPLTNFSHALEWPFFGSSARGYFAVNVALYAIVSLLVLSLLRWLRLGPIATFSAALLFALHPVHTEVVDGVAGRSELLALLFSLGCVLSFLRALYAPGSSTPRDRVHAGWSTAALLLGIGACGSKESALMLPVLLAAPLGVALAQSASRAETRGAASLWRRGAGELAPWLIVLTGYVVLRVSVLGHFSPEIEDRSFVFPGLVERLYTMGAIYLEYLRLLVWPDVLQLDFYYERAIGVREQLDARVALGWLALLATLGAGLTAFLRIAQRIARDDFDPRSSLAAAAFGLWWFALFLVPVSHIVDFGALMAERFLFSPSVGAVLVFSAGVSIVERRVGDGRIARLALAGALACLCLAGALRSEARSHAWRDSLALWTSLRDASPDDARAWSTLGAVQLERDELDSAQRSLERAVALDPASYGAHLNLAVLEQRRGRLASADAALEAMIPTLGADHQLWLNRSHIAAQQQRLTVALAFAERAHELHPYYAPTQQALSSLRDGLAQARATLERERLRARAGEPPSPIWYRQVAKACRALGDDACEEDYTLRATGRRAPSDP